MQTANTQLLERLSQQGLSVGKIQLPPSPEQTPGEPPKVVARASQSHRHLCELVNIKAGTNVGSGVFGSVALVSSPGDPTHKYAIKTNLSWESFDSLTKETQVALKLNHPNLLKYFGSVSYPSKLNPSISVVMEAMTGSLGDLVQRETPLATRQCLLYLRDIAKGLKALHAKGLIHNDLKADNILVNDKNQAVVGDFGRTRSCVLPVDELSSLYPPEMDPNTLDYSDDLIATDTTSDMESQANSPEPSPTSFRPNCFSPDSGLSSGSDSDTCSLNGDDNRPEKSDTYGFGYVALQLLCHKNNPQVWTGNSLKHVLNLASTLERFEDIRGADSQAQKVLDSLVLPCLNLDREHRPETTEILKIIDWLLLTGDIEQ